MIREAVIGFLFHKKVKRQKELAALVVRLSLEEATLAHNELTYGGFASTIPYALHRGDRLFADPNRAYASVEVATSLFEYIQRLSKTPITLRQKGAYRVGLTKAVVKILLDRAGTAAERYGNAMEWLGPFLLEQIDFNPSDRSHLDETILEMKRAAM